MDGIELMASAMHAMQNRVDVAAGNLANVSSDGFRRSVSRVVLGSRGLTTWATVDDSAGALRHTGRALDLTVAGPGGILVRDAAGRVALVRSSSFERSASGEWRDARGRALLCERGVLRAEADATVDERGVVTDPAGAAVGRIRLSGAGTVQSGFLEGSNVDAVHEMVDVLGAQRAFETAQKTLAAIDDVRARASSEVARVKP